MQIVVIGVGHVGLVTAACLAKLGHNVVGLDTDSERVRHIHDRQLPFYEPELDSLVSSGVASGKLRFSVSYAETVGSADFVFIAVGTPTLPNGESDLSGLRTAVTSLAPHIRRDTIVVNKSTVPIGTAELVAKLLHAELDDRSQVTVISNPEFLREGTAVDDFLSPDRIIYGSYSSDHATKVDELFSAIDAPRLFTDPNTAEMIKYASNAFLATRISFINEIARISERVNADIKQISKGIGLDHRIGPHYLDAGLGYGGSCFPKDVMALAHSAEQLDLHPQLLQAVMDINADQRRVLVGKVGKLIGGLNSRRIAVLGLAFKPGTDDLRNSPAIEVIELLTAERAHVVAHDPRAMPAARKILPEIVELAPDAISAARGADALVVATEWPEYLDINLDELARVMSTPVVVDGRNLFDPGVMRAKGFIYAGSGAN